MTDNLHEVMSNGSVRYKKNHGPMIQSNYEYFGSEVFHNDLKTIASKQDDPVQILGKFVGDWLDDLYEAISLATQEEYTPREHHPDFLYTVLLHAYPEKMKKLQQMPSLLGFEPESYANVQMQRPGCCISRHEDPKEIFKNKKGKDCIRILITLAHWEYGQILCFNNRFVTEWEPGTIIYADYANTQHFTTNCSWHTRPILLITGPPSPELKKMISNKEYKIFEI